MFRKILVPLDQSPFSEQALGPATLIGVAAHADIDLVLVHEPRPLAGSPDVAWHANQVDGEEAYLTSVGADLTKAASITTTHAVVPGDVTTAICNRAKNVAADLIVMTSHGRTGLSRAWVGSVADGVLRKSGVPVFIIRPSAKPEDETPVSRFRRILVPLDGSELSNGILESAVSLARFTGATLSLLRVVQPVRLLLAETAIPFAFPIPVEDDISTKRLAERAERELSRIARTTGDDKIGSIDTQVIISSDVGQAIIDFALGSGIDAIAMSTHGRGASRLIAGSVADKVIRSTALPMLLQGPAKREGLLNAVNSSLKHGHAGALTT